MHKLSKEMIYNFSDIRTYLHIDALYTKKAKKAKKKTTQLSANVTITTISH